MSSKQSLTTKHIMALFGVSAMTVHSWGKGTATRDPLPSTKDAAGKRTFPLGKTKQWAKRYGVAMLVSPEGLLTDVATKPGPKAKAKTPPEKKAANPAMAHAARLAAEAATKKKPRQVAALLKAPKRGPMKAKAYRQPRAASVPASARA